MKNFFRLVGFAWPYRVRFWASLGCALLVAALWGANISAVYPLLQILFYSQNLQKWMAEKIDTSDAEIVAFDARLNELDFAAEHPFNSPDLRTHAQAVTADRNRKSSEVNGLQLKLDEIGPEDQAAVRVRADLAALKRARLVADARYDELVRARKLARDGDKAGLRIRLSSLGRERANAETWLARYRWVKPRADRFLPHGGFHTLLLLMAVVMTGVAVKGLFLFLQEVLVADIVQLTLFDIRNKF